MFKLSNNLIGILNFITFLLSIPILGAGIWLSSKGSTDCDKFLVTPLVVLGVFLALVSLAGLVGACCRNSLLLWIYLFVMFVLIVLIFCFTIFAFVVTNKGAGTLVSGKGYKEYRLSDYSSWLQKRVEDDKYWGKIRNCLSDGDVCRKLADEGLSEIQFARDDLSPVQSGCCKPPTECGFTFVNATTWTKTASNSTNPDCTTWSNDQSALCYNCQSCKAGIVATLKNDWKKVAIVNIIFLIFLIIVYSVGCCAFRNVRSDNYYSGWKGHP